MESEADIVKSITQDFKDLLYAALPEEAKERAEGNSPPPRKSGGQPGNQNARKHGLYSKTLTPEQLDAFPEVLKEKYLDKEIAVLRLNIEALLATPDPDMNLVLRAFGTLARMIRESDRSRYGV